MAGSSGGRGGTTSHHSHRDSDEWNTALGASSLGLAIRTIQRDAYFRRQFRKRLEPAESAGKIVSNHAPQRFATSDGDGLEPGWANLFLSSEEHKSEI